MPSQPLRQWILPDAHNIRDLGGYAGAGGVTTAWGRLLRGDDLWHLSEISREALVNRGLTLVIDLRGRHELAEQPSPFAAHDTVDYRNIALFDRLAPIGMLPAPFDMAARYCEALDYCGGRLADVLTTIADAPEGVILFHCTAGKDRTGVIAALLLLIAGVAEDDIAADYALTAELGQAMLERLRQRALANGTAPAQIALMLASDEITIRTMLAHLRERHGGIASYLSSIGLSTARTERLRARLSD